jgi:hypothetical protein
MRVVKSAAAAPVAPIARAAKALELRLHSDGSASFATDVEGGRIVAEMDEETSTLRVTEILPDGIAGEELFFSVSVPEPAEEEMTTKR